MKCSKSVEYQGVSPSVPLIEEIKKHIQDKPQYRSVAAFVKEAIRDKMYSKPQSGLPVDKAIEWARRARDYGLRGDGENMFLLIFEIWRQGGDK